MNEKEIQRLKTFLSSEEEGFHFSPPKVNEKHVSSGTSDSLVPERIGKPKMFREVVIDDDMTPLDENKKVIIITTPVYAGMIANSDLKVADLKFLIWYEIITLGYNVFCPMRDNNGEIYLTQLHDFDQLKDLKSLPLLSKDEVKKLIPSVSTAERTKIIDFAAEKKLFSRIFNDVIELGHFDTLDDFNIGDCRAKDFEFIPSQQYQQIMGILDSSDFPRLSVDLADCILDARTVTYATGLNAFKIYASSDEDTIKIYFSSDKDTKDENIEENLIMALEMIEKGINDRVKNRDAELYFDLDGIVLTDRVIDFFNRNKAWHIVSLSNTRISNPKELLTEMPNLRHLDLDFKGAHKYVNMQGTFHCPKLRSLSLKNGTFNKITFSSLLEYADNLEELSLSGFMVHVKNKNEDLPAPKFHLPNLKKLSVNLFYDGFAFLASVLDESPNLEELILDLESVSAISKDELKTLAVSAKELKLKCLTIKKATLHSVYFFQLCAFLGMEGVRLELMLCSFTEDDLGKKLLRFNYTPGHLYRLRELVVVGTRIPSMMASLLVHTFKALDSLDLRNLNVEHLLGKMIYIDKYNRRLSENLTSLNLHATNVTYQKLAILSKYVPNLRELDISYCPNLIASADGKVADIKFAKLRILHVHDIPITQNLKLILHRNRNLQELVLGASEGPALKLVNVVSKKEYPNLTSLKLYGPTITQNTFRSALSRDDLECLELEACGNVLINLEGLLAFFRGKPCNNLKTFKIVNMYVPPDLTDLLLRFFPGLKRIEIEHCPSDKIRAGFQYAYGPKVLVEISAKNPVQHIQKQPVGKKWIPQRMLDDTKKRFSKFLGVQTAQKKAKDDNNNNNNNELDRKPKRPVKVNKRPEKKSPEKIPEFSREQILGSVKDFTGNVNKYVNPEMFGKMMGGSSAPQRPRKTRKKGTKKNNGFNPTNLSKGSSFKLDKRAMNEINEVFAWLHNVFAKVSIDEFLDILRGIDTNKYAEALIGAIGALDVRQLPVQVPKETIDLIIEIIPEMLVFAKQKLLSNDEDANKAFKILLNKVATNKGALPEKAKKMVIEIMRDALVLISKQLPSLIKIFSNSKILESKLAKAGATLKLASLMPGAGKILYKVWKLNTVMKPFLTQEQDIDTDSSASFSTNSKDNEEEVAKDKMEEDDTQIEKDILVEQNMIEESSTEELGDDFINSIMNDVKEATFDDLFSAIDRVAINTNFSFRTWEGLNTNDCDSFASFQKRVDGALVRKQPNTPNALVFLPHDKITDFTLEMMRHQKLHDRQYHYIHDLNDVELTSLGIRRGKPYAAESELALFCKNAVPGDVLVVNISKHRRSLNSIIDTYERKIKEAVLPKGVRVMLVCDEKQKDELDADIYRRCGVFTDYKVNSKIVRESVIEAAPEDDLDDYPKINLFHDENKWKHKLENSVILNGAHMRFENGPVDEAKANKKKGVYIVNPPKEHKARQEFDIWLNTQSTKLGNEFRFYVSDEAFEYTLGESALAHFDPVQHADYDYPLNKATFDQFFKNHFLKKKKFYRTDGWLVEQKNKNITIFVNGKLDDGQWVEILDEMKVHHVTAQWVFARPDYCPKALADKLPEQEMQEVDISNIEDLPEGNDPRVDLVVTKDIDKRVALLLDNQHIDVMYSINKNTTFTDIISHLNFLKLGVNFKAESVVSPIWEQLQAGKTVLLEGEMSPELRAKLSTLFKENPGIWINGEWQPIKSRLIIVTGENHDIPHALHRFEDNLPQPMLEKKKPIAVPKVDDIQKARFDTISDIFNDKHWAELLGKYGVGKSVFARKTFKAFSDEQVTVFVGEDQIETYLTCNNDGIKLLLVDEYNLKDDGHWDMLKGMANAQTPGVLYKNKFYPTTDKHKVIFAGNPRAYEGRESHRFIDRYVPQATFNEFTSTFLAEKVVQPIIDKALLSTAHYENAKTKIDNIINLYEVLKKMAGVEKAISARNLSMFTLRFVTYCLDLKENKTVEDALGWAIKDEAEYLFGEPAKINAFFEQMDMSKPVDDPYEAQIPELKAQMKENGYTLTNSRKPILKQLIAMLNIREQIKDKPELAENMLRGILIEGETSIGKSALLKHLLLARGFKDGFEYDQYSWIKRLFLKMRDFILKRNSGEKKFYHITASDPKTISRIMKRAFKEGAIVILDEINTIPLENTFNDYLTGVGPDGKRSKKTTFRMFGTQNPAYYSKREPLSDALQNRFIMLEMPEFPACELKEIISTFGIGDYSEDILDAFVRDYQYGKINELKPLPTPDILFHTAKKLVSKLAEEKRTYESTREQAKNALNFLRPENAVDILNEEGKVNLAKLKDLIVKTANEWHKNKPRWYQRKKKRLHKDTKQHYRVLKQFWLEQMAKQNNVDQDQKNDRQIDQTQVPADIAERFTTTYLVDKFKKAHVNADFKLVKANSKNVRSQFKEKTELNTKECMVQKTAKFYIWSEIAKGNKEEHATFAKAKSELLEAQVF